MPEQTNVGERLKMCGSGELYVAARFRTDCDEEHVTANRQVIDKCRDVDFSSDEQCPVFYPCLKSCALYPESSDGACGSADDSVRIVGNWKSKELEFQIRRDTEVVTLFKTNQRRMFDCKAWPCSFSGF